MVVFPLPHLLVIVLNVDTLATLLACRESNLERIWIEHDFQCFHFAVGRCIMFTTPVDDLQKFQHDADSKQDASFYERHNFSCSVRDRKTNGKEGSFYWEYIRFRMILTLKTNYKNEICNEKLKTFPVLQGWEKRRKKFPANPEWSLLEITTNNKYIWAFSYRNLLSWSEG